MSNDPTYDFFLEQAFQFSKINGAAIVRVEWDMISGKANLYSSENPLATPETQVENCIAKRVKATCKKWNVKLEIV
jgi:hypothetical protein